MDAHPDCVWLFVKADRFVASNFHGSDPRYHVWVPPAFRAKLPPSTGSKIPVTKAAASDARKTAGPITSSGSPRRFIGMPISRRFGSSGSVLGSDSHFLTAG